MKMKIRQLWHVLFDHPWVFADDLPIHHLSRYSIEENTDTITFTHYSRCRCGLLQQRWSAFLVPQVTFV